MCVPSRPPFLRKFFVKDSICFSWFESKRNSREEPGSLSGQGLEWRTGGFHGGLQAWQDRDVDRLNWPAALQFCSCK